MVRLLNVVREFIWRTLADSIPAFKGSPPVLGTCPGHYWSFNERNTLSVKVGLIGRKQIANTIHEHEFPSFSLANSLAKVDIPFVKVVCPLPEQNLNSSIILKWSGKSDDFQQLLGSPSQPNTAKYVLRSIFYIFAWRQSSVSDCSCAYLSESK